MVQPLTRKIKLTSADLKWIACATMFIDHVGCHLIDLVVQFCGFPDEIVPFNVGTKLRGVECIDCGFAVLRYRDGVSFVKTAATELNGVNRRSLVICGEKATVEIRPLEIPRGGGLDDTVMYVSTSVNRIMMTLLK